MVLPLGKVILKKTIYQIFDQLVFQQCSQKYMKTFLKRW